MVGLLFAPIAGAMAFVITYEEYRHHHRDRRAAIVQSVEMALVTTVFFVLLALVVGAILPGVLGEPL